MCLLPIAIGCLRISKASAVMVLCSLLFFFLFEAHFLFWAYRLEFLGQPVFLQLLFASMLLGCSQFLMACAFVYFAEKDLPWCSGKTTGCKPEGGMLPKAS
eukprot:GHVQ01008761.1.p2 GENE.GHVQ01008761.1~~GHVQ01008761.1.p2  ORF type:complete len:101 (-),score=3.65 GHVQ01008761.1:346-648(-)